MGLVIAVSKSEKHEFSKRPSEYLELVEGEGIKNDAHRGITVKHRSRVKVDPTQPNLRQVHFIHNELIEELRDKGFKVAPSTMGENITTFGIDLLALPTNTILKIGDDAIVQVTGLRNPCAQLDNYQKGLTAAVLDFDEDGSLIRKAGIMGIVLKSGRVQPSDSIEVVLPTKPYRPLEKV